MDSRFIVEVASPGVKGDLEERFTPNERDAPQILLRSFNAADGANGGKVTHGFRPTAH
jgi:hypothetical protein